MQEQKQSELIRKLVLKSQYREMPIVDMERLIMVQTPAGLRTVLPPALWAVVFKEHHDSIWSTFTFQRYSC